MRSQTETPPTPAAPPLLLEACREALYWLGGHACSPEERHAAALLERAVREATTPAGAMPEQPEPPEVVQ